MSHFIKSIELEHFRGFKNIQTINLAKKGNVAFIIGPNNTGKSLVSRALQFFRYSINGNDPTRFAVSESSDKEFYNLDTDKCITIALSFDSELFRNTDDPEFNRLSHLNDIWLEYQIHKCGVHYIGNIMLRSEGCSSHRIQNNNRDLGVSFNQAFTALTNLEVEDVKKISLRLYEWVQQSLLVFDPIRSFDREGGDQLTVSGLEIVKWLNEDDHASQKRIAKEKVRRWLQKELNLEAPTNVRADVAKKHLVFSFQDGIELSTKEIGTGYTMLYILLMEIERSKKKLFVIDEIESHLQPGLIRQLMKIIKNFGNVHFIVSTHSPIVMETASEDDLLYRSQKRDRECSITGFFRQNLRNPTGAFIAREVCNELGVIPGDALLSNCVIWVEGPSEVFWLRTLLKSYYEMLRTAGNVDYTILEGLHYSILMTGGSTISHYSFQEADVDLQLIDEDQTLKVLRVNPNPFVVIDSDNAAPDSMKALRHIRIAKELNEQNRFHPSLVSTVIPLDEVHLRLDEIPNYWLLNGKELENYTHPDLLKNFYSERSTHGNSTITGVSQCANWDVFSNTEGVGTILEQRGLTNVAIQSGSIKHKDEFARYMFRNFEPKHFLKNPISGIPPNSDMIDDLIAGLEKIVHYIKVINQL